MAAADLVWLEDAESDLQAIFDYICVDNFAAATDYVDAIMSSCDRLRSFPLSGRAFNERYRVLVVRNHLVFYRHEERHAEVIIAAIIDGRRDVAALLHKLGGEKP